MSDPTTTVREALTNLRAAIRETGKERVDLLAGYVPQERDEDDWFPSMVALASEELELGEAVFSALIELEEGDHATASRDFGRGVAYAIKHIRAAITAHYEAREDRSVLALEQENRNP